MTIYLDRWNAGTPAWDAIDIAAAGIANFSLKVSYESPRILSFTAALPQQTTSVGGIVNKDLIRLRHSTYDGGGGAGVDPVFEGIVSIEPGTESIGVKLTAIDPTGYSNYPLMSFGYVLDGSDVVPDTGGFPRVVWNCKQDVDDDYAMARSYNDTVSEIIKDLFDDQLYAVRAEFAGPSSGNAYVTGDLTTLTMIPQDKVVFDSENLRPALIALLQQNYPTWRLIWTPGDRLWRFHDLKAATEVTLTLNDPSASDLVLSFEPHISVEDRFTAVEIFGPPAVYQWDEFHAHPEVFTPLNGAVSIGATSISVDDGDAFPATPPDFTVIIDSEIVTVTDNPATSGVTTMTVLELAANHADNALVYLTSEMLLSRGDLTNNSGTTYDLEEWGAGVHVYGMYTLQITDTNKRQILRRLAYTYNAPTPGMTSGNATSGFDVITTNYETSLSPVLMVKWAANNMGDGNWQSVDAWEYSANDGRIYFGSIVRPTFLYRYNPVPPLVSGVTGPHCENPIDVQFVFCSPANPLKVRYPTSGFSGTAYSLYGVEKVKRLQDEMLALNYERDPLLTSSDRLDHFETLAEQTHAKLCDVVFAGVAMLSGLRWDYLNLGKRINIAAVDADGVSLTTGWEASKAWLTEVTFGLSERTTTLVLNNSQLELMGLDVAKMKQALGIRKLIPIYKQTPFTTYTPKATPRPDQSTAPSGGGFDFRSGSTTELVGYVDENNIASRG